MRSLIQSTRLGGIRNGFGATISSSSSMVNHHILVRSRPSNHLQSSCLTSTSSSLEGKSKKRVHEVVFLGPDEQIIPQDLVWIVKRAEERGYPLATAFMSSKPGAGFNHKVYGVTSEGVAVFLNTALLALNLHPSQQKRGYFTVKLGGGPDGDVAGNMLKILHRDYGSKQCKVVGIADGTAVIEDANGIDLDYLVEMFHQAKPLSSFERSKLSQTTSFHLANTPEGIRLRNTMHNRVKSDAFVPGGGRPATINERNWRQFLISDDPEKPSSKLIVEGANLFLTPKARDFLSRECGVTIVKDSSANKCGVICSSYEVISSMLLSESEFLKHKDELVVDVLARLRYLAKCEADLLFREQVLLGGPKKTPLPDVSVKISAAINKSQDILAKKLIECETNGDFKILDDLLASDQGLVKKAMPKFLAHHFWDRVKMKIPRSYLVQLAAANITSELVYQEGISFVHALSASEDDSLIADLILKWSREREKVAIMAEKLMKSTLTESELVQASKLLNLGGARAAVEKIHST